MLRKKVREIMNTRVSAVSFYTLKHLELQSCNRKTTITHNDFQHCRVRFSSSVRQPFSKQLYMYILKAGTKVGPDQLRPASRGRINSDQLGSTRIMKKNIKLEKTEIFTYLKAKIPVNNGPN